MVVLNLSHPGHGDHALSCTVRTKLNDQDTDPNLSTGLRAIPLQRQPIKILKIFDCLKHHWWR